MKNIHLSDALELIKRAESFIAHDSDPVCKELTSSQVASLKQAIYERHCINVDSLPVEVPFCCHSKQLVAKDLVCYQDLSIAIGLWSDWSLISIF
jgi:hypothetical protein